MSRYIKTLYVTSLLVVFVVATATAQVAPSFLTLPQRSVATTDDALSVLVNPAGLGVKNKDSFYLLAPYLEKGDFGDWGYAFGGEGFAFVGEYVSNKVPDDTLTDRRRYTWGLGFGEKGFYLGAAYSWTTRVNRENNWDIGMMMRPFRFASLGAVARGVNSPDVYGYKTNPGYDVALAIRPMAILGLPARKYGNRLTISADAQFRKFNELTDLTQEKEDYTDNVGFKIGASLEIIPGVTGHLDYLNEIDGVLKRDAQIWGGISFGFGFSELGTYQQEGTGSGVAYLSSHDLFRPTVLKVKKPKYVKIVLSGPIVEYQRSHSIFHPRYRTVYKLTRQIKRYADDPEVAGILLKIKEFEAGWAKLQEIRDELVKFKETGKKIIVYMETGGNGSYYLASVADRIYLPPGSDLGLSGLAAHMVFIRGTLDKVGVDPQLAHIGKYKSASEMLTRHDMSEAQAEATNAILDDIYDDFISEIATGREITGEELRDLIDQGPFTSEEALEAGLIDSLVYEDQLNDLIKELHGTRAPVVKDHKFDQRRCDDDEWDDMRTKSIAIIYGIGAITSGKSTGGGVFGGESMGSETISKAIRNARENKDVAAIVFRINSPGGSGLASELILREVKRCTEGDNKKPIIVSMSDVAGSGGYYVACQADTIIASRGTITGSIGAITGKLAYHDLQKKIGINTATLRRGKHADMYAGWRSFTDEEWEKLNDQLNQFYQIFLRRVAEGRDMDTSQVHEVAQGRIWSGKRAKEIGLIDETGGLDVSIEMAARIVGIEKGESFNIVMYPKKKDLDIPMEFKTMVRGALPTPLLRMVDIMVDEYRWDDYEMLYLMPYELVIE